VTPQARSPAGSFGPYEVIHGSNPPQAQAAEPQLRAEIKGLLEQRGDRIPLTGLSPYPAIRQTLARARRWLSHALAPGQHPRQNQFSRPCQQAAESHLNQPPGITRHQHQAQLFPANLDQDSPAQRGQS